VPYNRGNGPYGAGPLREVQYSVGGVMRSVGAGVKRLGVGLVILVIFPACSSSSSRPPLLPDCQANDAGCSTQIGVGGGDDSGSAASCDQMDLSGSSQCTQCAGLQCCSQLTTCLGGEDPDCASLYNCEEACGGLASCVASNCGKYTSALATFNELETCLLGKCAACSESGIGDPCAGSANGCAAGLTCLYGWCTEDCTASSTCAGLGPNGTNALGLANACLTIVGTGDVCVPGCATDSTDSDCASFAGTLCLPTTAVGGATVQVCSRIADAGP
jgi:hypothetical protein